MAEVENNEFRELGAGGIEIWNAPFEGLYAHDVLIQNNRFVANGVTWRNRSAWPAIWSAIFGGKIPSRCTGGSVFLRMSLWMVRGHLKGR